MAGTAPKRRRLAEYAARPKPATRPTSSCSPVREHRDSIPEGAGPAGQPSHIFHRRCACPAPPLRWGGGEHRDIAPLIFEAATMKDVKNPLSIVPVRFPTAEVANPPAIASPIFFDDSIRLPTGGLDKERVIDCIAASVSKMLHKLTPEYSRDWFQTTVRKLLREDRSPFDRLTVAAAVAGDEKADRELGRGYVEIPSGGLSNGPGGHLHGGEDVEHRILNEPHKRRPGRRLADNFVRDPELCALIWEISRALRKFGVPNPQPWHHGHRKGRIGHQLSRGRAGPPRLSSQRKNPPGNLGWPNGQARAGNFLCQGPRGQCG